MDANRRRTPRLDCDIPVTWRRGRVSFAGRMRSFNQYGAFIATEPRAIVNYIIEVSAQMPWGVVEFTAIPRFVGYTPLGIGLGVEIHVMDRGDREQWSEHYQRALARARLTDRDPQVAHLPVDLGLELVA